MLQYIGDVALVNRLIETKKLCGFKITVKFINFENNVSLLSYKNLFHSYRLLIEEAHDIEVGKGFPKFFHLAYSQHCRGDYEMPPFTCNNLSITEEPPESMMRLLFTKAFNL